jgi:hypothetical protein
MKSKSVSVLLNIQRRNSLGLQIGFNTITSKKNGIARTKYLHSRKSKTKRTLQLSSPGSAAMKNTRRKTNS